MEITESTAELVMASCEDMVMVGGRERRQQLTAWKNWHRKFSNFPLHKGYERQCGKYANLNIKCFFHQVQTFVGHLRAHSAYIITDT